jgi:hypothetical protein
MIGVLGRCLYTMALVVMNQSENLLRHGLRQT